MQTITLLENKLWLNRADEDSPNVWKLSGNITSMEYEYENDKIKSLNVNSEFGIECGKFRLGNSTLNSIEETTANIVLRFG